MLELDFFGDIMGLYEQNENGLVTFWGGSPSVDNIKHGQTIVPGRQWAQKARKMLRLLCILTANLSWLQYVLCVTFLQMKSAEK